MKRALPAFLIATLVAAAGCGGGGGSGGTDTGGGSGETFAGVTKLILPVLAANPGQAAATLTTPASSRAAPEWMTWGDMADEAAFIFLDPAIYETDGYSLGVNNIYHLLNDFGQIPDSAANSFTAVTAVPWFEDHDAGSAGFFPEAFSKSYTDLQGDNYVAKTGNSVHVMRAFTGGGGSRASSVFQVIYDTGAGTLQARFQGAWDYTSDFSNAFVMRFEFFGNPATHEFTLRATKWNSTPGAYYIQLVGKGVSQGAGAHFLFKAADGTNQTGLGAPKYFCYDAATGIATDVSSSVASSECAAYQADVDAVTGLVDTDMPMSDVFDTAVATQ